MNKVSLSAQQQEVFNLIEETREHVFITGRAGTGKSTLLNHLAFTTEKTIAVCAPTGVAALNVGGQTIHSLFCSGSRLCGSIRTQTAASAARLSCLSS